MSEWKAADSVSEVLDELRGALFNVGMFQLAAGEMCGISAADTDMVRQKMCFLVEFGVRAGLIHPDEGNDWLDGIWGRKAFGLVCNKHMSKDSSVVAGAVALLEAEAVR